MVSLNTGTRATATAERQIDAPQAGPAFSRAAMPEGHLRQESLKALGSPSLVSSSTSPIMDQRSTNMLREREAAYNNSTPLSLSEQLKGRTPESAAEVARNITESVAARLVKEFDTFYLTNAAERNIVAALANVPADHMPALMKRFAELSDGKDLSDQIDRLDERNLVPARFYLNGDRLSADMQVLDGVLSHRNGEDELVAKILTERVGGTPLAKDFTNIDLLRERYPQYVGSTYQSRDALDLALMNGLSSRVLVDLGRTLNWDPLPIAVAAITGELHETFSSVGFIYSAILSVPPHRRQELHRMMDDRIGHDFVWEIKNRYGENMARSSVQLLEEGLYAR